MKILFIQPTCDKKGHYGKYTLNLCQELARLGNEVILFTNKAEPRKFLKSEPLFKIVEYKGGAFSFEKFDEARQTKPWLYFYGYLRNSFVIFGAALEYAKKEKPDIIQVTDVEFGILSFLLWRKGKRNLPPVVLLSHAANFSFSKYPGNLIFRLYKVLQREILRFRLGKEIKASVTFGEYHKEELQKQFRLPPEFPIKVIYDGAEPPEVSLSVSEARQKLGIDYKGPIFLLFGILRRDKGLEYLLEAARILTKNPAVNSEILEDFPLGTPTANTLYQENPKSKIQNPKDSFKILIAGFPFDYEPKQISDMVMRFGLEDSVILRLGYVPDEEILLYFFAADCAVFPYYKAYAGGTGPLLKEAAMHKKPVIVTRVSEMGRLVAEKQMGLVAEAENSQDLAQKMAEFLRTPAQQRQKWGQNAFNAANTWEKMARQYYSLYEEVSSNN